jgi:hypothetical protein
VEWTAELSSNFKESVLPQKISRMRTQLLKSQEILNQTSNQYRMRNVLKMDRRTLQISKSHFFLPKMLKRNRPPTLKLRMPPAASNHCKIESSACISRLIARSGQFNGDKTKYSAASPNLQALHKRGESDIFNQRLL